jgi:hypothetical protein
VAREFENLEEIQEILSSGRFEELKGALENEFFEAKSEPWDSNSERGKFNLATDISSMASMRGGIIVFGASTKDSDTHQSREIDQIPRLPESLAPSDDRYWQIVGDWIYPPPFGISFRWHPDPKDPTRGMISVYVPNYGEESRPFLVAHYLPEKGKRISSVVGLSQRLGSTTKHTPIQDLHAFVREGRRLDEIHRKLDTIIARTEIGDAPESKRWIIRMLNWIRSLSD